jgi:hypothetical protein
MAEPRNPGRQLAVFFSTLALACLLGAGLAFGATYFAQTDLERDATRDARKLADDVIRPLLVPSDVEAPIGGERYDALLAAMDERVLGGPIDRVRLWAPDGTILFADDADLVGTREADMREDIHATIAGTAQSTVVGSRFRTLTSLRIGEPPTPVAVELGRSHVGIVEAARDPWYPWAIRGAVATAVCAGLAVASWILFALVGALGRLTARRRAAREAKPTVARSGSRRTADSEPASYMAPGFQEEVQARLRAEEELDGVRRERDALLDRVRHLEAELDGARGGSSDEARLRQAALARERR